MARRSEPGSILSRMDLRSTLFRVMLAALGVAALGGVVAVLSGTTEVIGRVAGTALVIAIACGAAARASTLLDEDRTRWVGLTALGWIVADAVLFMAGAWGLFNAMARLDLAGWATAWGLVPAGVAVVAMGVVSTREGHRVAGLTGMVLSGLALGVFLIGAWGEFVSGFGSGYGFADWAARWMGAGAVIGGLMPLVAGALAGMQPGRGAAARGQGTGWGMGSGTDGPVAVRWRPLSLAAWWRWVGVVCGLGAMGLWAVGLIADLDGNPSLPTALTAAAFSVAYANVMRLVALPAGWAWFDRATIGVTIATAVLVWLMVHEELGEYALDTGIGRATAAGAILAGAGTLAWLIGGAMHRRRRPGALPVTGFDTLRLTCPRCGTEQGMAVQRDDDAKKPAPAPRCAACGLGIRVRLEEPTCPGCGYLMRGSDADACPECGLAWARPMPADAD